MKNLWKIIEVTDIIFVFLAMLLISPIRGYCRIISNISRLIRPASCSETTAFFSRFIATVLVISPLFMADPLHKRHISFLLAAWFNCSLFILASIIGVKAAICEVVTWLKNRVYRKII